jgi:hypothetical protein
MMEQTPDIGVDEYTISVRREKVDGEACFVARVAEFPDVTVYEDSAADAYQSLLSVVSDLVDQLRGSGAAVPVPATTPEEFSGRVTFRMPRSLHGRIDARAAEEGVSINTWLVAAAENYLSVHVERRHCRALPGYRVVDTTHPSWAANTTALEAAVVVIENTMATLTTEVWPHFTGGGGGSSIGSVFIEDDAIHRHFVSART